MLRDGPMIDAHRVTWPRKTISMVARCRARPGRAGDTGERDCLAVEGGEPTCSVRSGRGSMRRALQCARVRRLPEACVPLRPRASPCSTRATAAARQSRCNGGPRDPCSTGARLARTSAVTSTRCCLVVPRVETAIASSPFRAGAHIVRHTAGFSCASSQHALVDPDA